MSKEFDSDDREYRLLAIAAARLRSYGLSQKQIAEQLERSQPEISRLLDYAERHGFLAPAPSLLTGNIEPADLQETERRYFLNEEIRLELSRLAPPGLHLNVQVLPDGDEEFARAAAWCTARLLLRSQMVGVMWGRTTERLVSRIGEHRSFFDPPHVCHAQCIPLCGDPVHLVNQRLVKYSASHLAAELGRAINPKHESSLPCLVGAPAYLPRRLFDPASGAATRWKNFMQEIPGFRAIFGPSTNHEKPLADRLDTILSGMGIVSLHPYRDPAPGSRPKAAREEMGDFIQERIEQEEDVTAPMLAGLIYGDIGGWLLERPNLRPRDQRMVRSLNQGWMGVQENHFKQVAKKAGPKGPPGCILVAAGPAKAEMLKEIVRRGLANELLIDTSLSAAIKASL